VYDAVNVNINASNVTLDNFYQYYERPNSILAWFVENVKANFEK